MATSKYELNHSYFGFVRPGYGHHVSWRAIDRLGGCLGSRRRRGCCSGDSRRRVAEKPAEDQWSVLTHVSVAKHHFFLSAGGAGGGCGAGVVH